MSSSPSPRIRILIADDHAVVRTGLRTLLDRQRDMEVVGEAGTAPELAKLIRETTPDVIVTDLRMPGGGVLDVIRAVQRDAPSAHVVVFSAFDDPADAVRALRAGATAYLLKQGPETDLPTAVRRAHAGRRFVAETVAARIIEERLDIDGDEPIDRASLLSEREAAVLDLIALGYTGPQIASELGVRVGTVETYRHRIRKKLGLKSRAEVTQFARSSAFRSRDS